MTECLDNGLTCSHQQGFDLNVLQKTCNISFSQWMDKKKGSGKKTITCDNKLNSSQFTGSWKMQSRQLYPSVLEIVGFTANAIQALQLKGRAWSPQKLITWIIQPISFKSDATALKITSRLGASWRFMIVLAKPFCNHWNKVFLRARHKF